MYRDGAYCPVCKSPMEYRYYHFNHIGSFLCPECGFARPLQIDYAATELDLEQGLLRIGEELTVHLAFRSIYNVYNILAAFAACRECGVSGRDIAGVIDNYILKNGRMLRFLLGAHHGTLLTSKHENSIAYDTNLRYVRAAEDPCTVVIVVDAVSRKYYTSETSWLWDIDFDLLNCEQVQRVLLCGQYAADLAVRFSFTEVPGEKIELYPDIAEGCEALKNGGAEDVYVLTCFSDRDKLLAHVEKEAV